MTLTYKDETMTDALLQVIASPKAKQSSIAAVYKLALFDDGTDWSRVNAAIINRYSRSGLDRIKRMAWQGVETSGERAG